MSAVQQAPVQVSTAGQGFSLAMTLQDPSKVGELRAWLSLPSTIATIHAGLRSMRTLHYARFLPLDALGRILFVAEFDGDKETFVKALATAIGDPLELLLGNMKRKPALPIRKNPDAFWDFVREVPDLSMSPFSAYGDKTVRDILGKKAPFPLAPVAPDPKAIRSLNTQHAQVSGGFSLLMRLEDPHKLPELLSRLTEKDTKARIDDALKALDYVHYARFLPLFDCGALMIITEFDGVMQDYVLDFAAALDHEFSMILAYMNGRPPLPVSAYPGEFWHYVDSNLVPDCGLYAAYPGKTVLDIVGADKPKVLPPKPEVPPATVPLDDVQANLLHSFHGVRAYHYYLQFPDPVRGREFVSSLPVTAADDEALRKDNDQSTCCTIGFTHAGLQALGLPKHLLDAFPTAFREGPAERAAQNGDQGESAPGRWQVGGPNTPTVHAVVSLHARPAANDREALDKLEARIKAYEVLPQSPLGDDGLYALKGEALKDRPQDVHFGYRDGISQPRIAGVPPQKPGAVADAQPGDFLLGHEYFNSRGGRYIGKLVEPLARRATYAAFRVIEQKAAAFERWLSDTLDTHKDSLPGMTREQLAAKLMGRWRDGTPRTGHDEPLGKAMKPDTPLEDFDYTTGAKGNDQRGLQCPIGAHIRRFNPRSGMVLGLPWGRTVLRRGLPYGARYEGEGENAEVEDEEIKRGLAGMFLCGDLEAQFEFLLSVWGRHDLSAFGLRKTQDPFTGGGPTTFRLVTESKPEGIEIEVPSLTTTIGSLYLFMPGLEGLGWIGGGKWLEGPGGEALKVLQAMQPPQAAQAPQAARPVGVPAPVGAAAAVAKPAAGAALPELDPTQQDFRDNPYPIYASYRATEPVKKVGFKHESWWVLSHALVTEVCQPENKYLFLKPGHNRAPLPRPFGIAGTTDDGLFFMDPPRHGDVRPAMDTVFADAISSVVPELEHQAARLLAAMEGQPTLKLVKAYAARMATWAFMQAMGIPAAKDNTEQRMVEGWTRAMLDGHDPHVSPKQAADGGSSGLALRAYLSELAREQKLPVNGCKAPAATIAAGLHKLSACPVALNPPLNADEVVNTAAHFALGGYLSTEFLITTGVYNLLHHKQWSLLADQPALLDQAVWEMLRFDAPFQMADRWVARDCELGGVRLAAGDKLVVVYGSANRDKAVFKERPEEFDIARRWSDEQIRKIYGFGHGIHRCIGEPLALEVTKAAIGALVKRFPKAGLAGNGTWLADPYFRSLTEVTVAIR